MDVLYWKHRLIRTPLEPLARRVAGLQRLWWRLRHPQLRDVLTEERWIRKAMARILAPQATYVDIGAHLGSLLSAALQLAPRGRHFAFEPVPRKAQWLREKFPDVTVHQMALSETARETEFYENVSRPGFSSLRRPVLQRDGVRTYRVKVQRLDDVMPPDVRPSFIKIDVEGAELGVLRGGVETIRRGRPTMVVESVGKGPARFGYTHADLFSFLDGELQYDLHRPRGFIQNGAPLSLEAFMRYHEYPFGAFNYIAAPRPDARTAAQAD